MAPAANLSDLLLAWEESTERGQGVTPEELCRNCPELLGELRRRIRLLQLVSPLLNLDDAGAEGERSPVIDGYEVLDRLDSGGMGVVYRAREVALNRVVAIKFPNLEALTSESHRARFQREAQVLAHLRHPNIVTIHAFSLTEHRAFFVMDYFPRGSLADNAS